MLNEFRQDLVSGEWVLFATGRNKRPIENEDAKGKSNLGIGTLGTGTVCPFEDPEKNGNEVLVTYEKEDKSDWFVKAAKNKFPAVIEGEAGLSKMAGPFNITDARGLHEVIIYREHERDMHQLTNPEWIRIFKIFQERYVAVANYAASKYVLIFHNHGAGAGASLSHPHSQIISVPILPPDVMRSINGSQDFFKKNGKSVYDLMVAWELAQKIRIIHETEHFVAFCPFVSKTPYEVRIFSKEGHAHFELCPPELLPELGETMNIVLNKIHAALNDPDYNFFIHTVPMDLKSPDIHEYYSWHIEIIPKMKMEGAFELGSGIEVNVVDPDEAARLLKEVKI